MIRAILACDSKGGISRNGVMPWPYNKIDLTHFKQLTLNANVIMGRKTWEASDMPSPLPGRNNIVVTSDTNYVAKGATVYNGNLNELLTKYAQEHTFVIGGAYLFEQVIEQVDVLHLTRISGNYDCDTFIPLQKVKTNFERIDFFDADNITRFETYVTRKINDLSINPKL